MKELPTRKLSLAMSGYWPKPDLDGSHRKPTLPNSAIVLKVGFPPLSRTHAVGHDPSFEVGLRRSGKD